MIQRVLGGLVRPQCCFVMVSNVFRVSLNVDAINERKHQAQATWMKEIGAIVCCGLSDPRVAGFGNFLEMVQFWNAETHML